MYTDYIIGDGDTTSFKEVQASKPYGDLLIQKLECVGHVQKRLGTTIPDKNIWRKCSISAKKPHHNRMKTTAYDLSSRSKSFGLG